MFTVANREKMERGGMEVSGTEFKGTGPERQVSKDRVSDQQADGLGLATTTDTRNEASLALQAWLENS